MTATAQASRVIPAEPGDVWETLTSRDGMKAYMMGADVETDWRVGGPITLHGEVGGKPFEDRGEVRSFDPWRQLSYTHASSVAPEADPSGDLRADATPGRHRGHGDPGEPQRPGAA